MLQFDSYALDFLTRFDASQIESGEADVTISGIVRAGSVLDLPRRFTPTGRSKPRLFTTPIVSTD